MDLNTLITHTSVETQVGTDLLTAIFRQLFGNVTFGIIEITENHGVVIFSVTGFNTGRDAAVIHTLDAHGATFDGAFAAWGIDVLIPEIFMHEGTGLVWAGHHAIPAADTDVLVNQHNAIGAFH